MPAGVAGLQDVAVAMPADATMAERHAALWAAATAPVAVWFYREETSTPDRVRQQLEALAQTGATGCLTRAPGGTQLSGRVIAVSAQQAFGGPCWLGGLAVRRAAVMPFGMPEGAVRGFGMVLASLLACASPLVLLDRCLVEPMPLPDGLAPQEGLQAGRLQERILALEAVSGIEPGTPYDGPHRGAVHGALIAASVRLAASWTQARNQSLKQSGAPSWKVD